MFYIKRKPVLVFVAIVVLSLSILIAVFVTDHAYAESIEYYSAEKYTESDYLLNLDGTIGTKTIQTFASEVKAAYWGEPIPELANVIPLQYLESNEQNAVFAHNGIEYGFYMTKDRDTYELLLIDFVYEFIDRDHSDLEYIIRIKPILQLSFVQSKENGEYVWYKNEYYNCKYYIANPRFATVLYNENYLNYGDSGYSKYDDDGLIISQTRVNYGKVCYATEKDLQNTLLKFGADRFFDISCSALDALAFGGGTMCGVLGSIAELCNDIYEVGQEKIAFADNENNIRTNMSKTAQRDDASKGGYSRVAGFMPTEEIILSDDNNSYAEFIVVLNDVNYKSRLIQICEFDIVRRQTDYSSAEYITGAKEDSAYTIVKERTIFDNQSPSFEIDGNNFDGATVPIYLLPNGEQTITFTPRYSGVYNFVLPNYTVMSLNGVQKNSFVLEAGCAYVFKIMGTLSTKIVGELKCKVHSYNADNQYFIPARSGAFISYFPIDNEYKKVEISNANLFIGLLNEDMQTLVSADSSELYYNFVQGKKYYFIVVNNTDISLNINIDINRLNGMLVGVDYDSDLLEQVMSFTNKYSETVNYKLELINNVNADVAIFNMFGTLVSAVSEPVNGGTVEKFSLSANETCYIVFSGDLEDIKATITINITQCQWRIWNNDMDDTVSSTKKLKPNTEYFVEMNMYVDGVKIDTLKNFILYSFNLDCKHLPGKIKIGNIENDKKFLLVPKEAPDCGLTIIVDDMITKIRLMWCDKYNQFEDIYVEYNHKIPNDIAMPEYKGRIFLGYFTAKGEEGKQYITNNMQGLIWDIDVDNATLYAHWEVEFYVITLHNEHEYLGEYTNEIKAYPNKPMPTIDLFAPTKTGYTFVGYFSERNGFGKKYYERGFGNSEKEAAELCIDYFWREKAVPCEGVRWQEACDGDLYAYMELLTYEYEYYDIEMDTNKVLGSTKILLTYGNTYNITPCDRKNEGYTFEYFDLTRKKVTESPMKFRAIMERSNGDMEIHLQDKFKVVYSKDACVAQDTLITLADGTQVPVETLTGDEMLMVWNMITGRLEAASILFIDKDPAQVYKVINLGFSDGTTVKVISEHGFWDYDLNKYVYLRQDASKYIGHWFNKGETRVQLVSVDVRDEYTASYSPVTYGHLCYYVNGMLSMPGGISGLFNIFEVNPDTMTINLEAMERDITLYGLYTYDEFAELVPVSEDVFNAFNGQYLKVAVGKGLITVEQLNNLASRYAEFFV